MNFGWEDGLTFILIVGWTLWKYACLQRADRKRGQSAPSIPPVVAREEEPDVSDVDDESEVFEEEWQEATETREEPKSLFPPQVPEKSSESVLLPSESNVPKEEDLVLLEDSVPTGVSCDGVFFPKNVGTGNVSTEAFRPESNFLKEESLVEKPKLAPSRLKNWMVGSFLLETPAFRRYR